MFKFLIIGILAARELFEISRPKHNSSIIHNSTEAANTSKANVEGSSADDNNKRSIFNETSETNLTFIYDVHLQKVSWTKARKMCKENGGDLLVIRSSNEENFVLKMMAQYSIKDAWLGVRKYGDKWMTVYDEFFNKTGWTGRFAMGFLKNCCLLDGSGNGLFTDYCELAKQQFVCETPKF